VQEGRRQWQKGMAVILSFYKQEADREGTEAHKRLLAEPSSS